MTTARLLVAVDAGTPDVAGAEHLVHLLDGVAPSGTPSYLASTHVVTAEGGHTAVAVSWVDSAHLGAVEHWCDRVGDLVPEAGVLVETGDRVAVAGPSARWAGARTAAAEHRSRHAGRIARFAGRAALERVVTVADVVASGGIDEVVALGAPTLDAGAVLDLREWVRPIWRAGRSVLVVQPARAGLVPFESRTQIPCCSAH